MSIHQCENKECVFHQFNTKLFQSDVCKQCERVGGTGVVDWSKAIDKVREDLKQLEIASK